MVYQACYECDGNGEIEIRIESVGLDRSLTHYDELAELQQDAMRVESQTLRLIEMKPEHSTAYRAQCAATLDVINSQADLILKGERL
jgi:hypothetical protein